MGRRLIYQDAQAKLKEYIRLHQMRPGDRLPAEAVLAADLGVSRPSLREATKSLQTLGVIEAQPGNGLFVSAFSFQAIIDQLPFGLADSVNQFAEVLVAREALEVGLMPFVAALGDGPDLEECGRLADVMTERERAGQLCEDVDREFHRRLYRGLNNALIDNVIEIFWALYARLDTLPRTPSRPLGQTHLDIVTAIRTGDGALASAKMRAHFDDVRERVASASPTPASPPPAPKPPAPKPPALPPLAPGDMTPPPGASGGTTDVASEAGNRLR